MGRLPEGSAPKIEVFCFRFTVKGLEEPASPQTCTSWTILPPALIRAPLDPKLRGTGGSVSWWR